MIFRPYGPFRIPVITHKRQVETRALGDFWRRVNEQYDLTLSEGIGCYIFSIRTGGGDRPWYVGKTDRLGFKSEVFQPQKLLKYHDALQGQKGTPLLYLLARHTPGRNALMRQSLNKNQTNGKLEELLIGTALARNPNLANKNNTKQFQMQVPGYMNEQKGRRSHEAASLSRLLGIAR